MAAPSLVDAALGSGSKIGRYFGIVSAVPSALFVLYVYALLRSGAWGGEPRLHAVARAMQHLSLGEASILLVITLALGLVLHPLQFAFVQVLEGYWGTSRLGRGLAARRVQQHRREFTAMRQRHHELQKMLRKEGRGRLNAQAG